MDSPGKCLGLKFVAKMNLLQIFPLDDISRFSRWFFTELSAVRRLFVRCLKCAEHSQNWDVIKILIEFSEQSQKIPVGNTQNIISSSMK